MSLNYFLILMRLRSGSLRLVHRGQSRIRLGQLSWGRMNQVGNLETKVKAIDASGHQISAEPAAAERFVG